MKAFVTGGTGFVGSALVRSLAADGHTVVSCSRHASVDSVPAGVVPFAMDVGDDSPQSADDLAAVLRGVDVVFHVAAKVAMWGRRAEFYRPNVEGTRRLLGAAKTAGVTRFIYTSSPSVIASGNDLSGVDESTPYPEHHEAFYPETKAIAERLVLAEHSPTFRTVALRPHLIFGPGDTNLIPTILAKVRAGRLAVIGEGKNRVDFSYIDDCVAAHRSADRALAERAANGGQPYFISQGEPMILWEFINQILLALGEPPVTKRVSRGVASAIAGVLELIARITGREPTLTRFLVSEMATEHFFDISRARLQLGYCPTVSMREGIQRTVASLRSSV